MAGIQQPTLAAWEAVVLDCCSRRNSRLQAPSTVLPQTSLSAYLPHLWSRTIELHPLGWITLRSLTENQ
jgi:hypothetical protein